MARRAGGPLLCCRGMIFSFLLPLFCPWAASHHAERKNGLERISLPPSTRNLRHSSLNSTAFLFFLALPKKYSFLSEEDITSSMLSKGRLSNLVGNEEMRHCRAEMSALAWRAGGGGGRRGTSCGARARRPSSAETVPASNILLLRLRLLLFVH